jgi:hypothetical protein
MMVMIAAMLLPMTALAESGKGKWYNDVGNMMVPAGATEAYTLSVGPVRLVVPPGALPEGGPVVLRVKWTDAGQFEANFSPEREFAAPVMMDFGTVEVVYWESSAGTVAIQTDDLDGDGVVGEIYSDHFSRFSGW